MKDIYIGLDLCKKNVQLSYFREDKLEPESIYQLNNTETYQLPNVMFYSLDDKRWYVGNSVSAIRFQHKGVMVEDVMGNLESLNHVVADGSSYTYEALLLILLRTHIDDFLSRSEDYKLAGLTVTLESYHPIVYKVLERFRQELKLDKNAFYVMSHENAFFQYDRARKLDKEEKL